MSTWEQRLNNAYCKAQRAINDPDHVDRTSGYSLNDIIAYIQDCPIGCEASSDAAINRINKMM